MRGKINARTDWMANGARRRELCAARRSAEKDFRARVPLSLSTGVLCGVCESLLLCVQYRRSIY